MKKIKSLLASALVFTSIFSAGIQNAYAEVKETTGAEIENSVQAKDNAPEDSTTASFYSISIDSSNINKNTTGSAIAYAKEIKDGEVKEYTVNISESEVQQYFDKITSYIDYTIKKQQEEMKNFFESFNMNF